MTLPYGGPSSYNNYRSQKPPSIKIVSEKEAKVSLTKLLNGRLNILNDHISAAKIRTELSIDLEKSFVPTKSLAWIVTQIECLDPEHHFEYDPRDDDVKFIKNGSTYESIAARTEPLPSMPLPSSSDRQKKTTPVPVDSICDTINESLEKAFKSNRLLSLDRIEGMITQFCEMDHDELMEFIETHIATGDICGHFITKNGKRVLRYNDGEEKTEEKRVDVRMNDSMKNLSVDRRNEKWREEREERCREDEKIKDYGEKKDERYDSNTWRKENDLENDIYEATRWRNEVKGAFPHIRYLPYLIYLLQKVSYDASGKALRDRIFQERLDDIVGGTFNYDLFGLTIFSELIYHRLVEVVERGKDYVTVQLNSLINYDNCRVELLRGYMAAEVYNYVLKKGPTSFNELYDVINRKNSHFLHEEFPKWNDWGKKERMEDVRASYKSNHEIFTMKGELLYLNEAFYGLVATPFVKL